MCIYLFIFTGGTVKSGHPGDNIMIVSLTGKLEVIIYIFIYLFMYYIVIYLFIYLYRGNCEKWASRRGRFESIIDWKVGRGYLFIY